MQAIQIHLSMSCWHLLDAVSAASDMHRDSHIWMYILLVWWTGKSYGQSWQTAVRGMAMKQSILGWNPWSHIVLHPVAIPCPSALMAVSGSITFYSILSTRFPFGRPSQAESFFDNSRSTSCFAWLCKYILPANPRAMCPGFQMQILT